MSNLTKFQILFSSILFCVISFAGGFYLGMRGYAVEIKRNPPEIKVLNVGPSKTTVDFALFWEVWEKVHKTYLERPVDSEKMMYGAIKGMVESLGDPYTSFLPPQVNKSVNNSLDGKYEGIGAELGFKDSQLIIVSPLDGSPAKAAGILAGDAILEIDGGSIRPDFGRFVKIRLFYKNRG